MSALEDLRTHEENSVRRSLSLLNKLRREINATILSTELTEFAMSRMRALKREIELHIRDLESKLAVNLLADMRKSFDLGVDIADEPIRPFAALGITLGETAISKEALRVATVFSADLIQGLTNDIRSKVSGILRRAALGTMTTQEAITAIGRNIDKGVFKSVSARAETIFRTEVLRIQSISTQLRQEANAKDVPDGFTFQKRWLATHDHRVRPEHLAAEGQTREVDEKFLVGGELLMFPRDPDASAENTINCRCVSQSVIEREVVKIAA